MDLGRRSHAAADADRSPLRRCEGTTMPSVITGAHVRRQQHRRLGWRLELPSPHRREHGCDLGGHVTLTSAGAGDGDDARLRHARRLRRRQGGRDSGPCPPTPAGQSGATCAVRRGAGTSSDGRTAMRSSGPGSVGLHAPAGTGTGCIGRASHWSSPRRQRRQAGPRAHAASASSLRTMPSLSRHTAPKHDHARQRSRHGPRSLT